jgi:hypothetical protein
MRLTLKSLEMNVCLLFLGDLCKFICIFDSAPSHGRNQALLYRYQDLLVSLRRVFLCVHSIAVIIRTVAKTKIEIPKRNRRPPFF